MNNDMSYFSKFFLGGPVGGPENKGMLDAENLLNEDIYQQAVDSGQRTQSQFDQFKLEQQPESINSLVGKSRSEVEDMFFRQEITQQEYDNYFSNLPEEKNQGENLGSGVEKDPKKGEVMDAAMRGFSKGQQGYGMEESLFKIGQAIGGGGGGAVGTIGAVGTALLSGAKAVAGGIGFQRRSQATMDKAREQEAEDRRNNLIYGEDGGPILGDPLKDSTSVTSPFGQDTFESIEIENRDYVPTKIEVDNFLMELDEPTANYDSKSSYKDTVNIRDKAVYMNGGISEEDLANMFDIDVDLFKEGGITYRGESFRGYNKPKRTASHPTKSHAVLAKEGDKVKLIRFGQQGVKGAGSNPKTAKEKARRKSFKARHAKNIKKGKMSAAFWANKSKW